MPLSHSEYPELFADRLDAVTGNFFFRRTGFDLVGCGSTVTGSSPVMNASGNGMRAGCDGCPRKLALLRVARALVERENV